jgi:16S rRNA processing protein RimM
VGLRLVVAQVRGLHGLNGVVRVEILTDRPEERFAVGNVLHQEGTSGPLTIVESSAVEDGPGWRLRFAEIRDRTAAEVLRNAYLETSVDRTADLEPGAAYWHEVLGAEVRGLDGHALGTVADVYRVGESEVLVVTDGPAGPFDLPVVHDIVRQFSPEQGVIVVDENVLDLGGAAVDEPRVRPQRRRPRWSRHGKGGVGGAAHDGSGTSSGDAEPRDAPPGADEAGNARDSGARRRRRGT